MASGIDLRATQACYCLAARRVARALTRLYDARLRQHGLRATQFSNGERLFEDIDLPSLGYRIAEHVATPRATHGLIRKVPS